VLLDGQTFERLDGGMRCVLRLQVGLKYVKVIVQEPLKVFLLDRGECAAATQPGPPPETRQTRD
jgi:hypothetical protein